MASFMGISVPAGLYLSLFTLMCNNRRARATSGASVLMVVRHESSVRCGSHGQPGMKLFNDNGYLVDTV